MFDQWYMTRALELAELGLGYVEPNPPVGCLVVRDGEVVGEGFHRRFGGPHAEVEALQAAGPRARGADLFVSLEPCCHHGKTPPCTQAIVAAGVRRVVAALADPFPSVAGGGFDELRRAGIEVESGLLEPAARRLLAPYLKLQLSGRPWITAKWAMTLDGKLATASGQSRWITGDAARAIVHRLRGRVDAILIGRGTALADDPLLTARPPGARVAVRVVVDSRARLPLTGQLVQTARDVPLLVAVGPDAPADSCQALRDHGAEVLCLEALDRQARLAELLAELGRRELTNLLVEGGAELLGALFDLGQIDEVHAFLAPRLFGGQAAPSPVGGIGCGPIERGLSLVDLGVELCGEDVYVRGRVARP
jgi:diaminohydroxyphosphoribosylaminopyrimidine deaminase/5-amino-6-(5-phosphoribosylamino)uracil reductase